MFIVKVPGINAFGKTNGCEKAGEAILKILKEEIFSNESGKAIDVSKLDLEEIHLDNSDLESANNLIYKNAFEIFEEKTKIIFLGGDHSISYSLTRAFFDYCQNAGKEPCLIIFDAHPDLMPASEFPTHEEWLRKLIDEGFPMQNILLVGTRNSDEKEFEFLRKNKMRVISMNQMFENLEDSCDIIMEFTKDKETYLSIDIDVLDPAFAPATGYPEPGGLTTREFLHIIQRLNKIKNLKAIDIVEINPEKDADKRTIKIGAKILSELI